MIGWIECCEKITWDFLTAAQRTGEAAHLRPEVEPMGRIMISQWSIQISRLVHLCSQSKDHLPRT